MRSLIQYMVQVKASTRAAASLIQGNVPGSSVETKLFFHGLRWKLLIHYPLPCNVPASHVDLYFKILKLGSKMPSNGLSAGRLEAFVVVTELLAVMVAIR